MLAQVHEGECAARGSGLKRHLRYGIDSYYRLRFAAGIGMPMDRLVPIDTQLFNVLQADVVEQRRDANLRTWVVDAFEDLFYHLEVVGVIGHKKSVFLLHDSRFSRFAQYGLQSLL